MATAKRDLTDTRVQGARPAVNRSREITVHSLMTVHEVADYIQMSTDYVYENANEIGGVKLGGKWRFRIERVDAYVDASSIKPRRRRRI